MTIGGSYTGFGIPFPGHSSFGITSGPDNNLWFTEYSGINIGKITTSGDITEFPIGYAGAAHLGITTGSDGNLWFTESGGQIGRITTAGEVTWFPLPLPNSDPTYITLGPDGALWFTEYNANKIGRITTSGNITEFQIPTANSGPIGITAGPDGAIWFTERTANQIGRITTSGVITEFQVPTPNSWLSGITAGPDGNIWFTEYFGNKIGKLVLSSIYSSISGRVTDDSNNPALGVTLTSSSGSSTTTNASGYYTFTNVITGTYTITPTKSGYIFAPITHPVTVTTSSVTGKDFRIRTIPPRFLDLPVSYSNFVEAALGNLVGSKKPGRVNSWVDHYLPNYNYDNRLVRWDGCSRPDTPQKQCDYGDNCYDGHSGIDLQKKQDNEPIYPAATGIVKAVHKNWTSKNCGARGCPYGNYVLIDHGNGYGYATFYAHLASVSPGIDIGTPINNTQTVIGYMGGSGGFPVHLHFAVLYDANGNGVWEEVFQGYSEVVDPYGWKPYGCRDVVVDPWNIQSRDIWKTEIHPPQTVGPSGGNVTSVSGSKSATIPPGALNNIVTLIFGDAPPVAAPSAQLRSSGHSFWLRVLEWLGIGGGNSPVRRLPSSNFAQPVTVAVTYGITETLHLNTNQLTLYRWNETTSTWIALPTTVDTNLRQASAQTTEVGSFDLQAPLICPADVQEIDDDFYASKSITPNGTPVNRLFDIAQDEDWLRFDATGGRRYIIQTGNLSTGVDTVLQVYNIDGVTMLASDDNSGGGKASRLTWQAPQTGTYFVRVSQAPGSAFGCGTAYQVNIAQQQDFWFFFPFIRK